MLNEKSSGVELLGREHFANRNTEGCVDRKDGREGPDDQDGTERDGKFDPRNVGSGAEQMRKHGDQSGGGPGDDSPEKQQRIFRLTLR